MTHNDLKKGDRVRMTPIAGLSKEPRTGTLKCAKRGIRREVLIDRKDGYEADQGDVYVWDITHVLDSADEWARVDLALGHRTQKERVQKFEREMFG